MISVSPATRYFADCWEDLWSGVSSNQQLLNFFNPRIVIQELLDEITLNKQKNISNENFFKRLLGEYYKSDPGSGGRLKIHLQMILRELNVAKNRPRYLPVLCSSALSIFTDFKYIEDCLQYLIGLSGAELLTAKQKADIRWIANHLIVEFRSLGYTDDEIRRLPQKIFSKIKDVSDAFYWEFPYPQKFEDWTDKEKTSAFRDELETYQSTLTEKDRIFALLAVAKKGEIPMTILFRVNGMNGLISLTIAEVLFYSPSQKRFIKDNNSIIAEGSELFHSDPDSDAVNAAVTVNAISSGAGESLARSIVEKALSLCRRVLDGESSLWLSKSYIAVDGTGHLIHGRSSAFEGVENNPNKNFKLEFDSFDRLDARLAEIEKVRLISSKNGWGRRFDEACYWLRKAEESASHVEQLLSYWICIETLCAKSDEDKSNWFETKSNEQESDIFLIKEIVGKIIAVDSCYKYAWLVHRQCCRPVWTWKKLDISPELIEKAQLNPKEGEPVYLINFISCCDQIQKEVSNDLLKEHVSGVHMFYHDKKIALGNLRRYLGNAQDELAFIYRMRNKIAHDGSSNHFLLPSLCKLAAYYAESFFNHIKGAVVNDEVIDLATILIKATQRFDRIEIQLETEEPISVFDVKSP